MTPPPVLSSSCIAWPVGRSDDLHGSFHTVEISTYFSVVLIVSTEVLLCASESTKFEKTKHIPTGALPASIILEARIMLMLTEQTPSTLGSFTLPTLASTGSVFCFSLGKLESRNRQTVCNCSSKPFLLRGSWWDYIGIGVAGVVESSALACFIACSKLSQPHPLVLQGVGFGKLTFSLFAWNDKSMRSYFCLFSSFTDIRKYRLRQANNLPKGWKWNTCCSRYELVLASFPGKDKEIP